MDITYDGPVLNETESTEWQQGDDPESHPMWDEELALEKGMLKSGADKLRDAVVIARQREQLSRVAPISSLMKEMTLPVAEQLNTWRRAWAGKRGVKPMHLATMNSIDPYVAAVVGIRSILDRIGHRENSVTNISMEIGRTLEHEMRIRAWEKGSTKEKAMFKEHLERMKRNKVTNEHRRLVNINRFNHHRAEGHFDELEWHDWSTELIFRVGWEVMDAIVMATGWFEIIDNPHHIYRAGSKHSPQLYLAFKPTLNEWIKKALDNAELNSPDYMPMVMPPKPWSDTGNGGYYTPYVKNRRLIRFKAHQQDQREGAAQEYDALDFPQVYRMVNCLQDTGYRINTRVLDVFSRVWTELRWTGKKACLPELEDRELPPRTVRMMEHREANKGLKGERRTKPDPQTLKDILDWKRKATSVYAFNATRSGRIMGTSSLLKIAMKYAKYDAIYFPHMLDFRGRAYPIPSYLSPQGNDLSRGLLTYSEEALLTERGAWWLAVCLASNWGHDKLKFEERVQWVHDNEEMLLRIAGDPYANNEWFTSDKPWQCLACIFEWEQYRRAQSLGQPFYSTLPGMIDGTCNGIQHLSALAQDEIGGAQVNLIDAEKPQDIYKFVAKELQDILEDHAAGSGEHADLARWWLDACEGDLPRSLTKRQVMVLPYGGTRDSFFGYTREWLNETFPVPEEGLSDEERIERNQRVSFMAGIMWQVVNEKVKGPAKVMKWLQDTAKIACENNQPIFWRVPSGFVVRHFYGEIANKPIRLHLDGERHDIQIGERTNKLSVKEQLQGIAPNYVHSLDASCLATCVNMCLDDGIRSFTGIHDAYGTHMSNMDLLAQRCREAFVFTHQHDLLGDFRQACTEVAMPVYIHDHGLEPLEAFERIDAQMPEPLELGNLELESVLESTYFFH